MFTHKSTHAHKRSHTKGTQLHNVSEKRDTNCFHGKYRHAMPSKNNDTCNVQGKIIFHLGNATDTGTFISRRLLGASKKLLFDEINFRLILITQVEDKYRAILSDLYIVT